MTWSQSQPPRYTMIRLRLHGEDRLAFRVRPADLDPDRPEWHEWEFLDGVAVHKLLTKVFRVPFLDPQDLLIRWSRAEHEGVRVLHGKMVSRDWSASRRIPDTNQTPPH